MSVPCSHRSAPSPCSVPATFHSPSPSRRRHGFRACRGLPVIVKPHHGHPGTSELVALRCNRRQRIAARRRSLLDAVRRRPGSGHRPGETSPDRRRRFHRLTIRRASVDGRRRGAAVPIPVYAEMGSINPVFLLPARCAGTETPSPPASMAPSRSASGSSAPTRVSCSPNRTRSPKDSWATWRAHVIDPARDDVDG